MHATPPPLFRCHRCGRPTRVVEQAIGRPARYACGHQDRTADLRADQLQRIQLHLDNKLDGIVASGHSYLDAATADPGQFMDDLCRAIKLAASADHTSLDTPPTAGWLRQDWNATGRLLRLRFGDVTSLDADPPIVFRITDV